MADALVMRVDKSYDHFEADPPRITALNPTVWQGQSVRLRYRLARKTFISATLRSHSPPPKFAVMSDRRLGECERSFRKPHHQPHRFARELSGSSVIKFAPD